MNCTKHTENKVINNLLNNYKTDKLNINFVFNKHKTYEFWDSKFNAIKNIPGYNDIIQLQIDRYNNVNIADELLKKSSINMQIKYYFNNKK